MDYTFTPNPEINPFRKSPRRYWRWALFIIVIIGGLWLGARYSGLGNATITVVNRITGINIGGGEGLDKPKIKIADDPEYKMPENDKNRIDILILGIRGEDDAQNGGMLTDTIILFSLDPVIGTATLTSIPRDLTVRVTDTKTEKINSAYIYDGLSGTKKLYSRILGVSIDNIIVFDFNAFKDIVDSLGGITITLNKPFTETQQWGYEFSLPVGPNTLNGDQALYYARSRYGSSDFDRSRRQMQIIMAIKAKADELNLAGDPLKALGLVNTVRKHIDTDLGIFDLGTIKDLISEGDKLDKIKRYQLTTENLLYETKVDGIYELLPRDNTLAHIKEFFRTVLTANPVLPTPIPADASPRIPTLSSTPKS